MTADEPEFKFIDYEEIDENEVTDNLLEGQMHLTFIAFDADGCNVQSGLVVEEKSGISNFVISAMAIVEDIVKQVWGEEALAEVIKVIEEAIKEMDKEEKEPEDRRLYSGGHKYIPGAVQAEDDEDEEDWDEDDDNSQDYICQSMKSKEQKQ